MRFTCKTFKRSLRSRKKSKFRANNTRRRRCLFKRKLRGGGNTLDRSIPLGSVLANPVELDKKENVSIL